MAINPPSPNFPRSVLTGEQARKVNLAARKKAAEKKRNRRGRKIKKK